jgi:hypothetical protein
MNKQISYTIVTSMGPVKETESAECALQSIKEKAKNSLWIYLDGSPVNAETLTLEKLIRSDEIILTSRIVGG